MGYSDANIKSDRERDLRKQMDPEGGRCRMSRLRGSCKCLAVEYRKQGGGGEGVEGSSRPPAPVVGRGPGCTARAHRPAGRAGIQHGAAGWVGGGYV